MSAEEMEVTEHQADLIAAQVAMRAADARKPRQQSKKTREALAAARAEGYEIARDELSGGRMIALLVWGMACGCVAFALGVWVG